MPGSEGLTDTSLLCLGRGVAPVFSTVAASWAAENEGEGELQEHCGKLTGFEQLPWTL